MRRKKPKPTVTEEVYKVTDLMSADKYTFISGTDEVRLYCKLISNEDDANELVRKLELLTHPHDTLYYGVLRVEKIK